MGKAIVDTISRRSYPQEKSADPSGAGSAGVDGVGVLDSRLLPDPELTRQWDSVIVDGSQKDRLLSQSILNFTLRGKVNSALLPLHGLIVLHGPPGTGKTSLARGLASRTAEVVGGIGKFQYIEVEPHAIASAALGRTQRAVRDLLGQTVAEQAARGPLVVLLDEVETLAASRARMSLEANPIDVHRATDAVLSELDQLASRFPNLLFIATSNFARAVDEAFFSRADLIEVVGLPSRQACRAILLSAVEELIRVYPAAKKITGEQDLERAAAACFGLDGRRIRKLVVAACAQKKQTALDPGLLTGADILHAVNHAHEQSRAKPEAGQ